MSELAVNVASASLIDQIDELSTRMILDSAATPGRAEFEQLGETAANQASGSIAEAAYRIAKSIGQESDQDKFRIASSGLMELRRLIDEQDIRDQSVVPELRSDSSTGKGGTSSQSSANNSLAADEDLIREFITESNEHLAAIDGQLLLLEKEGSTAETLNTIFRGFHTIKGLAGFLEFAEIQSLTHEVETLLDLARNAQLVVTPAVIDVVLESTDVVREQLVLITQRLAGKACPASTVNPALLERIRQAARSEEPSPERLPLTAGVSAPLPRGAGVAEERAAVEPSSGERRVSDATSVRIDTVKLDQLFDMVGEMVIAQTLIRHSSALASVTDAKLQRNLAQLARITGDVQRISTGMRMVPIGTQFNRTARVVRDLARRAGKQVAFEATGGSTELDKTIAEELSDPLLHMVRNSIDHGIESTEERIALGKDPTAHIGVTACHKSGQIVVSISDDGRGLNREKILAKALRNGLIQPSAVPLTDNEVYQLIFEAGLSTAEAVSDISGRGVGMDVVRRHVQKLRGRIDIQSKAGVGTTFSIKLPLTLALIEGLIVAVGRHRYIAPIFSVREMFRPRPEMLSTVQGKGEMAMVRGSLMPIIRLHRRFDVEPRTTNLEEGTLVVAESEDRSFCLFVDDLIGKQEVVIKSLGQGFKHISGVAGCAILGDGRVGLILDLDGIYKGRS
jgi:two-component system chemotaxis sensor kinase CheA